LRYIKYDPEKLPAEHFLIQQDCHQKPDDKLYGYEEQEQEVVPEQYPEFAACNDVQVIGCANVCAAANPRPIGKTLPKAKEQRIASDGQYDQQCGQHGQPALQSLTALQAVLLTFYHHIAPRFIES
jgi:hypothetical protein